MLQIAASRPSPSTTTPSFCFKITLCLRGSAIGLNCCLPFCYCLSPPRPLHLAQGDSGTRQTVCLFPSHCPRRGPVAHLTSEHLGDFMPWTFSTPTWPPFLTVTPWTLSSAVAPPESLNPHLLSFSPSGSPPLATISQSPRTSGSVMPPFLQPISPTLCGYTCVVLHFINSLDSILNCLAPLYFHPLYVSGKTSTLVSLMISFLQEFILQAKKCWRKSRARKWSPLLIRGP